LAQIHALFREEKRRCACFVGKERPNHVFPEEYFAGPSGFNRPVADPAFEPVVAANAR
jgi:hypothetical protein